MNEDLQNAVNLIVQNKGNQELSTALETNGFIKEVEKEVEVKADYTEDGVFKFLESNQATRDKIFNNNRDTFLSKLHGVKKEELTDEMRKADFVSKTEYEKVNNDFAGYKKETATREVFGANFDLLKPHIDFNSIELGEEGYKGIAEQKQALEQKFPHLKAEQQQTQQTSIQAKSVNTQVGNIEGKTEKQRLFERAEKTGNRNDIINALATNE